MKRPVHEISTVIYFVTQTVFNPLVSYVLEPRNSIQGEVLMLLVELKLLVLIIVRKTI